MRTYTTEVARERAKAAMRGWARKLGFTPFFINGRQGALYTLEVIYR